MRPQVPQYLPGPGIIMDLPRNWGSWVSAIIHSHRQTDIHHQTSKSGNLPAPGQVVEAIMQLIHASSSIDQRKGWRGVGHVAADQ